MTIALFERTALGAFIRTTLNARGLSAGIGEPNVLRCGLTYTPPGGPAYNLYGYSAGTLMEEARNFATTAPGTWTVTLKLPDDSLRFFNDTLTSGMITKLWLRVRPLIYSSSLIVPTEMVTRVSDKLVTLDMTPQVAGHDDKVLSSAGIVRPDFDASTDFDRPFVDENGDTVNDVDADDFFFRANSNPISAGAAHGPSTTSSPLGTKAGPLAVQRLSGPFDGDYFVTRDDINGDQIFIGTAGAQFSTGAQEFHISRLEYPTSPVVLDRSHFEDVKFDFSAASLAGDTAIVSYTASGSGVYCTFTDVTGNTDDFAAGIVAAWDASTISTRSAAYQGVQFIQESSVVRVRFRPGAAHGVISIKPFSLRTVSTEFYEPETPLPPESQWFSKTACRMIVRDIDGSVLADVADMSALVDLTPGASPVFTATHYEIATGIYFGSKYIGEEVPSTTLGNDFGTVIVIPGTSYTAFTDNLNVVFLRADNIIS